MRTKFQFFKCKLCNGYNDILRTRCSYCKVDAPDWVTSLYQVGVEFERGIFFQYGCLAHPQFSEEIMTDEEELFAKFYNHEKVLVKDMDQAQLWDHREELRKIAFEAKARLVAADDEGRERKAKSGNKEWLVTEVNPDVKVSDAINVVKTRAARMTKLDKMRRDLEKAGIDEATIKQMMKNLEVKATDQKLKTVTFNVPAAEIKAIQVKEEKPKAESKPFDPSSLFGKKD